MVKSVESTDGKLHVTYFQRRPRKAFSFSLEFMFNDIRYRLKNKVAPKIKISKFYNNGIGTKIYNIGEAAVRQSDRINHITGEVHFLNLLMRKKKVILTILDCGMIHRKKGISQQIVKFIYLIWPINSSKFVTCISEITKLEVIKYTNCPADKITVIPVAVDPIYQPHSKRFNKSQPNILHIGVGYNKNIYRLIQALKGITCELTIIGKIDSTHVDELKKNNIIYSNWYDLSQEEMFQKYAECDILAFVSTFEGFGMPIIEANCVERVVITSNLSSMPEVANNAACLVNPYDIDEIRSGIQKLINDEQYREEFIANGRINKLRFDGDKIANSYFELYERMYSMI